MPLIDNEQQTLKTALRDALATSDRIDISVGYFYFSGFQSLAEELRDKKIRILVGLEIDPELVPEIVRRAKDGDEDLDKWQLRENATFRGALRKNYIAALTGFMNDSDIFDDEASVKVFDLFMRKIEDGTLEIRKTINPDHAKFYIVHNRNNNDSPGTVFMGSSNFTYNGLVRQGEMNGSHTDKDEFEEFKTKFERKWNHSESIAIADEHTSVEFLEEVKAKVWRYSIPKPYLVYLRVLHELFAREDDDSLKTPARITKGRYSDLEYQIDAVRGGLDRLKRYDGVILADVVGLGKSIIAAAIARNLDEMKTVIIAPRHLVEQWESYKEQFGIRGSKVFSSGKIDEVYRRYRQTDEPILFILDEAHRYRNEDTNDYQMLHQICRSHPQNKVMLLTATPFNNDPKDVFALIKLFQTPGQATIRSVDNLSIRFHALIGKYKKLRRSLAKKPSQEEIDRQSSEIANEQRRLIESVVIRRSRLDLRRITRYRENLERLGIDFPEVKGGGPELLRYDLGDLAELYADTLDRITDGDGFVGARYKPSKYVKDDAAFREKFKDELDDSDLKTAQANLAQFMRRLLVMRFESSKAAFRSTLRNMIASNELVERWWDELGMVPIMKKGHIPDPRSFSLEDGEEDENIDAQIDALKQTKGLIAVEKEMLEDRFIELVRKDIRLLKEIERDWFESSIPGAFDPKIEEVRAHIERMLAEALGKKIVIFSSYADTVNYVHARLAESGFARVMKYTAGDASAAKREEVQKNFDAAVPEHEQADDYDVLVATDALSEGVNLHRAGVVINYDIPYNPTRVIQRIGRINRINKKVFDEIHILNCFPTDFGESEVRIQGISTLKMRLINEIIGSDTKTLTSDEQLVSFFKDEYQKASADEERLSWDAEHIEAYDTVKDDADMMRKILAVPRRSRIARTAKQEGIVVFGKKGDQSVFTLGSSPESMEVVSAEEALPRFNALADESGAAVGDEFTNLFARAKEELFGKHELPQVKGRRADAIRVLKALAEALPKSRDYCEDIITVIKKYDDLSDGALKHISKLNLKDTEGAYRELKDIAPSEFVKNVLERVERVQKEPELILLAEQFIP